MVSAALAVGEAQRLAHPPAARGSDPRCVCVCVCVGNWVGSVAPEYSRTARRRPPAHLALCLPQSVSATRMDFPGKSMIFGLFQGHTPPVGLIISQDGSRHVQDASYTFKTIQNPAKNEKEI